MQKIRQKKLVCSIALAAVSALVMTGLVSMLGHEDKIHQEEAYSAGWSASLNGKEMPPEANISDYAFSALKRGDVIELGNRLPKDLKDAQTLSFLL